jgi:hypothetical protein
MYLIARTSPPGTLPLIRMQAFVLDPSFSARLRSKALIRGIFRQDC